MAVTTNFYNDLRQVKIAKDLMVTNLNATSDTEYTNADNIITLANGILDRNNTLPVPTIDYSENVDHYWLYERPSWYPNIKTILANAPNITVGSTTYYPLYIVLLEACHVKDYFYKTYSSSTSAVNYYNCTGGDAYIFSDDIQKDISNADSTTLVVGTTVTHTWNDSQDFYDATDELKSERVRYAIVYGTSTTTAITFKYCAYDYYFGVPVVEMVTGNCIVVGPGGYSTSNTWTFSQYIGAGGSLTVSTLLKYLWFGDNTTSSQTTWGTSSSSIGQMGCSSNTNLRTFSFPANVTIIQGNTNSYNLFYYCSSLSYIKFPSGLTTFSLASINYCYNLPYLQLPNNISITSTSATLDGLKELDISGWSFSSTIPNLTALSLKKLICGQNPIIATSNALLVVSNNVISLASTSKTIYSNLPITHFIIESAGSSNALYVYKDHTSLSYDASNLSTCNISIGGYAHIDNIVVSKEGTYIVSGSLTNYIEVGSIYLSDGVTSVTTSSSAYGTSIDYMNFPTTITTSNTSNSNIYTYVKYVELYGDFNMTYCFGKVSGSNYPGRYKSIQWLKDLCIWLKNNTGTTAKTLTLGTGNMANMNSLYLTYDPNNINDITWVDSSTSGAITATEYCSQVKNWTLS